MEFTSFQEYRTAMFQAHASFSLNRYLNPLWDILKEVKVINEVHIDSERLILVVDNRPTPLLRFCILNSLLMTGFRYRCTIYTDQNSLRAMKELFSDITDFVQIFDLAYLDTLELTRYSYNKVLKSSDFWSLIPATSVLLTQQDAFLIEPLSDEFFKYDYIGSPWSPDRVYSVSFPEYQAGEFRNYKESWQNMVINPNLSTPTRVGNGGHSIRSVRYMLAISSAVTTADNEPEDVFYSRSFASFPGCFPSDSEAARFSSETSYSFAYGTHASHLYLEGSFQVEIYERHIKHLAALYSANSVKKYAL